MCSFECASIVEMMRARYPRLDWDCTCTNDKSSIEVCAKNEDIHDMTV
jgi:hypothetical protein